MIQNFSKSLTDSDVRYKFFALNKLQAELFGKLEKNLPVKLICSDNGVYDAYIDTYGRIKAPEFFNNHTWLTEGTMVDFKIDTESCIISINIDMRDADIDVGSLSKELTPELEKVVRDFLADCIINGKYGTFKLYNGLEGIEYNTKDAGRIDLLCIDGQGNFVVFEIKKDKTSDKVVGQIQRYMGWVKEKLAGNKNVKGIIVMRKQNEDDTQFTNLKYSIKANPNISLKFYQMNISLLDN